MTERRFDRLPNLPDARDWLMADHLGAGPLDAVDTALTAFAGKSRSKTAVALAKAVVAYLHTTIDPAPPPPTTAWTEAWQLDQGSQPFCVGFGWCQRFNTLEASDPDAATFTGYTNDDAIKVYMECKVIDGEPGQLNGSQVRSGAKAMQARGKLTNYVFAASVADVVAWVTSKGPVVIGSDWLTGMDSPDANGVVTATGTRRGGHCYLCDGYDPATGLLRFQNSWGTGFAKNGFFFMSVADFTKLFNAQGDACAALEA